MSACWWKWGFDFVIIKDKISKLPLVNPEKLDKLYARIEELCKIHDLAYDKWTDYFDFLRANYIFARDLAWLLSWTTKYWRATIFLLAFFWTTLFGRKYFNFK